MKKQIIIFIFINFCLQVNSQTAIKTPGPCTDAELISAKGKWRKDAIFDRGSINSVEANKRIDDIHKLTLETYPQPTGVEARWHRSIGISYFGSKIRDNGKADYENINMPHFVQMGYTSGFFRYHCGTGNFMTPSSETGTFFGVIGNSHGGSTAGDEEWTINGLPVRTRNRAQRTVRGFEILQSEPGDKNLSVLIHRPGMSPYIPVTRKQYLDQCIIYKTKLYDEMISGFEQLPVRSLEEQEKEKKARLDKLNKQFANDPKKLQQNIDYYLSGYQTDQQRRDDQVTKARKIKTDELKKFSDELEKTTREGLLDAQAVISVKYYADPVFVTDPTKGSLLVTENPDYIRKDLPKYVPQFFIVYWVCNDWEPQKKLGQIIEQNFPFEKLQSMIDK